jgi:CRP/FNR family cyclic AMP-dependent transcriptional regulator
MSDTTVGRNLAHMRLLSGVDDAEINRLQQLCRWRSFRKGQTVFEAGSASGEVYFIYEGRVNVMNMTPGGREVVFASLGPCESFGELAAIDRGSRSANIVAAEETVLAELSSHHFLGLLERQPEVSVRVLRTLAAMVRMSDIRIMELSTLAASQRVYAELLRMAQPDAAVPSLWVVRSLPPLREIASRVSTTRETVARAMGHVYSQEIVRKKGRNLYIMDRARLEIMTRI